MTPGAETPAEDQRVRGRAALVHGDRIRIGSVTLEVRRPLA